MSYSFVCFAGEQVKDLRQSVSAFPFDKRPRVLLLIQQVHPLSAGRNHRRREEDHAPLNASSLVSAKVVHQV